MGESCLLIVKRIGTVPTTVKSLSVKMAFTDLNGGTFEASLEM